MLRRGLVLFLVLVCVCVGAQDRTQNRSMFLIPQTVYVGDRAVLTLPLPSLGASSDVSLDLQTLEFLSSQDIEIHRIVLENRLQGSRLVLEFTAFAPGLLELPSIEIGDLRFTGITVEITSIFGSSDAAVLSESLPPVSVPGTSLFVYGTLFALVLFLLLVLWALLWSRKHLAGITARWKNLRLIRAMAAVEKRLAKNLLHGDKWLILDKLSGEFRVFLSLLTGENCRAMTAGDFGQFSFPESFSGLQPQWGCGFLQRYFKCCDELRFSGAEVTSSDVRPLLTELRQFLSALNSTVRGKTQ